MCSVNLGYRCNVRGAAEWCGSQVAHRARTTPHGASMKSPVFRTQNTDRTGAYRSQWRAHNSRNSEDRTKQAASFAAIRTVMGDRSSRRSCFRNPASQEWSPSLRAAGCIARKVIPLDTTPFCCVQYGADRAKIACNWSCMQDLYARKLEILAGSAVLTQFPTLRRLQNGR